MGKKRDLFSAVCLTVMEVKVRQMPPKPFRESAKKMSADKAAERKEKYQRSLFTLK